MPNDKQQSWAQNPDGTRDWEAIFEDPQKGLVALANKAETPAQLNESMLAVIRLLFSRRGDAANIDKFTGLVAEMAPADGDGKKLGEMKSAIAGLLRDIKDERERKVAEYLSGNKKKKGGDRRAPPTRRRPPAAKKAAPPPKKNRWQTVFFVWAALATVGAANLGYFHYLAPKKGIGGKQDAQWVRGYVEAHLSGEAWKVLGVEPSENPAVEIRVMMIDRQNLKSVESMEREKRVVFFKEICPPPQVARVRGLLDKGWGFRVVITGPNGKLTDGWCRY